MQHFCASTRQIKEINYQESISSSKWGCTFLTSEKETTTTSQLCLHHVEGGQTGLSPECTSHDYNKAVMEKSKFHGAHDSWHRFQLHFCLFVLVSVYRSITFSYYTDFSWQLPFISSHFSVVIIILLSNSVNGLISVISILPVYSGLPVSIILSIIVMSIYLLFPSSAFYLNRYIKRGRIVLFTFFVFLICSCWHYLALQLIINCHDQICLQSTGRMHHLTFGDYLRKTPNALK